MYLKFECHSLHADELKSTLLKQQCKAGIMHEKAGALATILNDINIFHLKRIFYSKNYSSFWAQSLKFVNK